MPTNIQQIARQVALDLMQGGEDDPYVLADAVALAVMEHAIAFVKARGDVENHVVAPGMWFAAGYLRENLLAELRQPSAETPQFGEEPAPVEATSVVEGESATRRVTPEMGVSALSKSSIEALLREADHVETLFGLSSDYIIPRLTSALRALQQSADTREAGLVAALEAVRDQTYLDAEGPELRAQNECNHRRAIEALAAYRQQQETPK